MDPRAVRGNPSGSRPHPLTAPRIFINVGGRAVVPEMPGADQVPLLTNTDIVALDALLVDGEVLQAAAVVQAQYRSLSAG